MKLKLFFLICTLSFCAETMWGQVYDFIVEPSTHIVLPAKSPTLGLPITGTLKITHKDPATQWVFRGVPRFINWPVENYTNEYHPNSHHTGTQFCTWTTGDNPDNTTRVDMYIFNIEPNFVGNIYHFLKFVQPPDAPLTCNVSPIDDVYIDYLASSTTGQPRNWVRYNATSNGYWTYHYDAEWVSAVQTSPLKPS